MNLYERIGGDKTIEKLVTTFYQHVLFDPELKPFFKDSSIDRLKEMQRVFFRLALGGPTSSETKSLYAAHAGRGIERKHLVRFTEHLLNTLREIGVEESDAQEIYRRISTYSDEVLGESSVDG